MPDKHGRLFPPKPKPAVPAQSAPVPEVSNFLTDMMKPIEPDLTFCNPDEHEYRSGECMGCGVVKPAQSAPTPPREVCTDSHCDGTIWANNPHCKHARLLVEPCEECAKPIPPTSAPTPVIKTVRHVPATIHGHNYGPLPTSAPLEPWDARGKVIIKTLAATKERP